MTRHIESFDGTRLAVHRLGEGRPVLFLHGLFSSAEVNWIKYGTARIIADAGFECLMLDLRAHGQSDAPQDASAYPDDVLATDTLAVVEALGLEDYDLVGYSLGARTAVRAVLAGLSPRKLVLGGIGLEGLRDWKQRAAFFEDMLDRFDEIERGDPAWYAKSFFRTMGIDRVAGRLVLQPVDDTAPGELSGVTMPTLALMGAEDVHVGSGKALAEALPEGSYAEVPGDHMSAITMRHFGEAIAAFLAA